jgi:hypothetical protein
LKVLVLRLNPLNERYKLQWNMHVIFAADIYARAIKFDELSKWKIEFIIKFYPPPELSWVKPGLAKPI